MELTGDQVLDYVEELALQAFEAGLSIPLLPLAIPLEASEARAMILQMRDNLLRKGVEPPEMPPDVKKFFFGGPRPGIIG